MREIIYQETNSYKFKKENDKIKAQEKSTIDKGFKYIIIIDKDYDKFIKI